MTDYRQAAAPFTSEDYKRLRADLLSRTGANTSELLQALDHAAADRERLEQIRAVLVEAGKRHDPAHCPVSQIEFILGDPHE
jgi:hypothetical protein